ncbi:MAG TPA: RNA polymerase sigma-70 factor [Bacteroidales bacterium]|nr:RNA polymerase sigma-70 factor [Bacteroidales bacterium]
MREDTESINESLLVRELSKGNILAFNTLFKEYSRRLYGFALGYLKSEEEAEELVQEVFTIIWEKRFDLKEELSFKSFLFTISFNIIKKHFKSRAYLSEYLQSGLNDEADTHTSKVISYNSLYNFIISLVEKMPERRRLIFIKSRFEGMSIREISEEFGISHKTVENQISDALKYLRENLKNEGLQVLLFIVLFLS